MAPEGNKMAYLGRRILNVEAAGTTQVRKKNRFLRTGDGHEVSSAGRLYMHTPMYTRTLYLGMQAAQQKRFSSVMLELRSI